VTPAWAGLAFGGDYNPEQWPREVWAVDHLRMSEAGITFASVGIFSWAHLEPEPGRYELDWLADVLDGLHAAGVRVDLATATASPPPWLARLHPESLPVDHDGRTRWPGARQAYCPSSTAWRERAVALVEQIAGRFGSHPAVALWHVGNEYGCHTSRCYCDACAAGFRTWLLERYDDLAGINHAWGTAFWSQRYSDVEEILPPRLTPDGAWANPTQQLDFRRFASDLLLSEYVAERDVLRRLSPGVPVTTNFMVMTRFNQLDYWRWAEEVDLVSTDYYPDFADPHTHVEAALSADLTRGLAGGAPWLLMETSPSAVNWQPRNTAKPAGKLRLDAVQQVARGADGFAVFQIRQSVAGAEKFHSGLIPHAGTDTRLWREVVELGDLLGRLGEVAGSRVEADVALVWGYESWWASELDSHPSVDVRYPDRARAFHHALWDLGVTADLVRPGADLSGYKAVVVPTLYLADDAAAEAVRSYVASGGHLLVTYFSGIVDENDHVRPGGYPGAFKDVLGVHVEEFAPLLEGDSVSLDDGGRGDVWTEHLHLRGAEAVSSYVDGPLPGVPAVTRNEHGDGVAWYVATRTDPATTASVVRRLVQESGAAAVTITSPGLEVVRRSSEDAAWLFVLNHTGAAASVHAHGHDLVSDSDVDGALVIPAGGVAVVRESRVAR
jgi:beta-galactosidase